jgi:hypothetical protein
VPTPVKAARGSAVVVFQGTVESFRGEDPDRRVIFRVSRVWKGPVGRSFEMPALETTGASCYGFLKGLLAPGNELIVFAYYYDHEYLAWRTMTKPMKTDTGIDEPGKGHKPK